MIAYADDLATVTGGPRAKYIQQLQDTWLSASVLLLQINVKELDFPASVIRLRL
jgi:hypothetical protein